MGLRETDPRVPPDLVVMLTISYPNGDVVAYVYGDHGWPTLLLLNGTPLVSGATYNA